MDVSGFEFGVPAPVGLHSGFRTSSEMLAEDHLVVALGVEIADDGRLLVAVLAVELPGWIVRRQGGRLDQEQPTPGMDDIFLDVLEELRPEPTCLPRLLDEDP